MENEKKNSPPQGEHSHHKHHRPPKKKGYFIEPTAGNGEKPTVISNAQQQQSQQPKKADRPAEKKPQPEQYPENRNPKAAEQNDNAPKKHHKRHKSRKPHSGGDKPQQNSQNQQNQQNQQSPSKKTENGASEQKRSHDNKNGNRDHRHSQKHNKQQRSSDALMPMPVASKKPVALSADDEYEEIRLPATDEVTAPVVEEKESDEAVPMVEVVGVRFKNSGKTYYFAPGDKKAKKGDYAIVETARGREYGEVSIGNTMVKETETVPPLRPILRIATEADRAHHLENKKLEENAFRICNEKIAEHGLDMKLIDAQYTFDNSKLLFYFSSDGRVDFRVLVKDLASVFRTRIELRQIGIRDEAKIMGGIGMCGRPLCCSTFLSDFGQVSIKMAKEQNLSLNATKISGICGRLMCCLRYEHSTYEYEIKRTPPVDSLVRTADGNGTVTEMNPLVGTVKVGLLPSPDTPHKVYKRDEVVMIRKKKNASPQEKA